mgnify:CR=1 FL=1
MAKPPAGTSAAKRPSCNRTDFPVVSSVTDRAAASVPQTTSMRTAAAGSTVSNASANFVTPRLLKAQSHQPVAVQLAPYFDVTAIGEPGTVIIDGWGISNAVTSSEQIACPRAWHGFVFSNAVCGAVGGSFTRCVAKCCEVGFSDSYLLHCIATRNTSVGALNCGLKYCTVIGNRGFTGKDAIYDHTGVQDCRIEGTIVWDNTKDGQPANGVNPPFDATGVDTDSIFVDAAHENYRLRMGSPYINLCEYFAYTFLEYDDDPRMLGESTSDMPMFDFDGNPRCRRGLVDFGPFEYQPTNDHQTITAPEPVEFAWIDEKCLELLAACGGDYDKAVLMKSANPVDISLPEPLRTYYTIWESYVADLDPTDSNQTFRAHISIENGVSHVWPEPNSPRRKYTIFGKEKLLDEKWQENLPGARFFKIKVGLK